MRDEAPTTVEDCRAALDTFAQAVERLPLASRSELQPFHAAITGLRGLLATRALTPAAETA